MTSQLNSPPTTTASRDSPIDYLDLVATQGAYLIPHTDTPVFPEACDDQLAVGLEQHLNALLTEQRCRRQMYHGAADEWPMGHTRPEIKEERKAELKAQEELEGATSHDGSDDDDNEKYEDICGDNDPRAGRGNLVAAPDQLRRPRRQRQADWLPTPPPSTENSLATLQRRKWQRIAREDEAGSEHPATKQVSLVHEVCAAAEDAVPNLVKQKDRNRRRTRGVGERKNGGKDRPSKVRATTTGLSIWLPRLRPRPRPPAV